jgi:phosphatidylserine/phosphatidylglycerophosphate/cardiolipin synthase-like enzyme
MIAKLLRRFGAAAPELSGSQLLDEITFYPAFLKDLANCRSEVIIESPFITARRMNQLVSAIRKLKAQKVKVVVNTRDPREHDEESRRDDAYRAVATLQHMGVHVPYTGGHHRKLAILDREILYEGSLNILSQNASCEVMRRVESTQLAWEMVRFTEIDKFVR